MYCAATAADCPFVAKKEKLMKMAAKKQCEGTMCPAGCCPEQNWFCCPDNMYCAATAADCPFVAKKEKLMKMALAQDTRLLLTMVWLISWSTWHSRALPRGARQDWSWRWKTWERTSTHTPAGNRLCSMLNVWLETLRVQLRSSQTSLLTAHSDNRRSRGREASSSERCRRLR